MDVVMRNPVSSIKNRYDARKRSALINRADAARDARNWSEAAALYRQALEIMSADPDIWVQHGHMLKETGSLDEAEAAYRKALALRPRFSDTYLMLGHVLKFKGKLGDALEAYRLAVEFDPKDMRAREEYDALSAKAPQASTTAPKENSMAPSPIAGGAASADDLRIAGDKARDARNWSGAAAAYKSYLAERPDDAPIWVQMGHALKESGYYDAADAAYKSAEALAPDVADTFLHHAHLLKGMGRTDDAIRAFRCVAALDPSITEAIHEADALSRKIALAPTPSPAKQPGTIATSHQPSASTTHLEEEIRAMRDRLGKAEEQLRLMQGQSRAIRVLSSELVKTRQEVSLLAPRVAALEAENRELRLAHEERLEAIETRLQQVRDLDPRHPFLLVEQHLSRRGKVGEQ
jgi:tetratricopeptide (TPR) repeat protein